FEPGGDHRIGSMDTICAKNNDVGFNRKTIAHLAPNETISHRKRQRDYPEYRERASQISSQPHRDCAKKREKEYRAGTQDTDSVDETVVGVNCFLNDPRIIGM